MANRIQLRRDHSSNWTRINPVLSDGEPGLEIDTNKVKYGDGSTAWRELSYASGAGTAFTVTNVSYFANDSAYLTATDLTSIFSSTDISSFINNIGYLTSGTVNQYVNSFSGTNQLVSGPYTMLLDSSTGVLSLSSASTILGAGTDPNVYIETISSGTTSAWTFGTNGVLTLPEATPVIKGAGTGTNVTIVATTGSNTASWVFGETGALTFPDATIQSTAYPSSVTNFIATPGNSGVYGVSPITDNVILVSTASNYTSYVQILLPVNNVPIGKKFTVKKTIGTSKLVFVQNSGGGNIDGNNAGVSITNNYGYVTVVWDGTQYWIIDQLLA